MIKFLIYGSAGWIGHQFIELLEKQNIDFFCGVSRVDNLQSLIDEFDAYYPTHVCCFIGRTHGAIGNKKYTTIDYLEQKGKLVENVKDNLYSPLILADLCKKRNIHLSYLGTGCIFQYDDTHPFGQEVNGFQECDKPNFFDSSYSIVKGYTDRIMHDLFSDTVLNVRIRMPITNENHSKNFITKILTYEKICSVPNSMTVLPELLPVMLDMALNKTVGTVNLTNPGLISHNEILEMYKEIVDPEFTWQNMSLEEQSAVLSAGRSNNFLDTQLLQEKYPNVKNIKDSVKDMLTLWKA